MRKVLGFLEEASLDPLLTMVDALCYSPTGTKVLDANLPPCAPSTMDREIDRVSKGPHVTVWLTYL